MSKFKVGDKLVYKKDIIYSVCPPSDRLLNNYKVFKRPAVYVVKRIEDDLIDTRVEGASFGWFVFESDMELHYESPLDALVSLVQEKPYTKSS